MANEQNLTPFKPGESGNPAGRPPGIPNAKTRYKRLLEITTKKNNPVTGEEEDFTQLELMDMAIFAKALKGDIRAYQEIMDRLEGRPNQNIDMNLEVDPRKEILKKYMGSENARQAEDTPS